MNKQSQSVSMPGENHCSTAFYLPLTPIAFVSVYCSSDHTINIFLLSNLYGKDSQRSPKGNVQGTTFRLNSWLNYCKLSLSEY